MNYTLGSINKTVDSLLGRVTKNATLKFFLKIGIVCAAIVVIYSVGKISGQIAHDVLN